MYMNMEIGPDEAKELSEELGRPCLVPLVGKEPISSSPAELYFAIRKRYPGSFLLESTDGRGETARYSVIGCKPLIHVESRGGEMKIDGGQELSELSRGLAERVSKQMDALEKMRRALLIDNMQIPQLELPRYVFGVTGYVGYDFVRSSVELGSHAEDDLKHPDLEFVLPQLLIVFDHFKELVYFCSLVLWTDEGEVGVSCTEALSELKKIAKIQPIQPVPKKTNPTSVSTRSNITRREFERNVEKTKKYIRAGDIIQAVLSRRIELKPSPPLDEFYMRLRLINPSPYMFFLDFPTRSIVGSSPEALIRVSGRNVTTRPIAGTRRRGENKEHDLAMERELLTDEKERAEHVMLVDLGRNDIGKVSEFGTVKVPEFMKVEKYGHVQHLVSTVTGRLQEDKDAFDALRAVFPAGTVTGAPKVRAMETIEELEPTRRGIYAGAVGSFNYAGEADFAITIRTLVAERGVGYLQVGAGVVADSIPWKEYYETENKARSLLCAAGVRK